MFVTDPDDSELFKRIWYAERDGKVHVGIDLRHYNKPGSPTFDRKDNALPTVGTVCCVATAWMLGGWIWGLAILFSCIVFAITTVNIWIMHRLRQRTIGLALGGYHDWDLLWQYGGLTLRRDGESQETNAGEADWRSFADRLPHSNKYE